MAKILVIDDEPHYLRLMQNRLESAGYEVAVLLYRNQEMALTLIDQEKPDLVVLDFTLPDIPGTELGRLIRHRQVKSNPDIMLMIPINIDINKGMDRLQDWIGVNHNDQIFSKPFNPEEFVKFAARILKLQSEADRRDEVQTVERERQRVSSLLNQLRDPDAGVRSRAAFALGQLGDKNAVASLLIALQDTDAEVRRSTGNALAYLGDKSAVGGLLIALKDEDKSVRRSAAAALGALGDKSAVPALLTAQQDEDMLVRRSAAEALGRLG